MARQYTLNRDDAPGELTHESPMPFGKYGPANPEKPSGVRKASDPRKMKDVPSDYLLWLWDDGGLWQKDTDVSRYIRRNWDEIVANSVDRIPAHIPGAESAQPEPYEAPEIEMEETPDSTQIAAIGHDPLSMTLRIKFRQGGVYDYSNFTDANFEALKTAPSIGSHFYKHIKANKDQYPYRRIG